MLNAGTLSATGICIDLLLAGTAVYVSADSSLESSNNAIENYELDVAFCEDEGGLLQELGGSDCFNTDDNCFFDCLVFADRATCALIGGDDDPVTPPQDNPIIPHRSCIPRSSSHYSVSKKSKSASRKSSAVASKGKGWSKGKGTTTTGWAKGKGTTAGWAKGQGKGAKARRVLTDPSSGRFLPYCDEVQHTQPVRHGHFKGIMRGKGRALRR